MAVPRPSRTMAAKPPTWANEAVTLLRAHGFAAWPLREGVAEWGLLG